MSKPLSTLPTTYLTAPTRQDRAAEPKVKPGTERAYPTRSAAQPPSPFFALVQAPDLFRACLLLIGSGMEPIIRRPTLSLAWKCAG
ncbi:uncharacterized protein BP01DRAFT_355534 [Aspergillus saccharolyticus JOP 1030-1]|uniref:Uncharacterized protein n=1 Tax=Aspergillus saccharolyticus JOP 1030-1 TaxID=1450539 RepID=A0A318ZG43_9EURO|nr:hypothetical protein BP01DRAFT_355534 [Aspergillus saccharolyticus JOP 1030-1]PYH46526.1 hypothetical protein BP01DRAFT_355534 [Aspergillus saccharolyticus JOP 1030-1]